MDFKASFDVVEAAKSLLTRLLILVFDSCLEPPTCHSRFWNELSTCWSWANWYLAPTLLQCTSCANCVRSCPNWRDISRCCCTFSSAAAVRSYPSRVRSINFLNSSSRDVRARFSGGSCTGKSASLSTWSSFTSTGDVGLTVGTEAGAEAGRATIPSTATVSVSFSGVVAASAMRPISDREERTALSLQD